MHTNLIRIIMAFCAVGFGSTVMAQTNSPFVFTAEIVYQATGPVYSLALDELQNQTDGLELAAQLNTGQVMLFDTKTWQAEMIGTATDPIEAMSDRPTLSIGDVHPEFEGNEVVALGNIYLRLLGHNSDKWMSKTVFNYEGMVGMLWGARAGNYDPVRPGDEFLLIQEGVFDFSNGYQFSLQADGIMQDWIYEGEVGMDSTAGEFDTNQPETEAIIATEMGPTYQYRPLIEVADPKDKWVKVWDDFDNAGWVVKIGDVLPEREGNEVVYGTRYNNRITISYPKEGEFGHTLEVIFEGIQQENPRNMLDIAIGDVLPKFPGDEIAGVDHSGSVYLVWRDNNEWHSHIIYRDEKIAQHNVVIGEVSSESQGEELMVSSQKGTLTLLRRQTLTAVNHWPMRQYQ